MSDIYVGDHGTMIEITITDSDGVVNLETATTITAKFFRGDRTSFDKTLTVNDAGVGRCTVLLTRDDINVVGSYAFQVTVQFQGGSEFTGNPQKFMVRPKIDAANYFR